MEETIKLRLEGETKAKQEMSLKWDYLAALTKEYTELKKRVERLERLRGVI